MAPVGETENMGPVMAPSKPFFFRVKLNLGEYQHLDKEEDRVPERLDKTTHTRRCRSTASVHVSHFRVEHASPHEGEESAAAGGGPGCPVCSH